MTHSTVSPSIHPHHEAGTELAAVGLGHSYGSHRVLQAVDFSVASGEFVCLVGPSGAGKTTLLRCLAGLQQPRHGAVHVKGEPITAPVRGVSVVFQDYSRSLLPWSSVAENVALPLRAAGTVRKEARQAALQMLALVGLDGTAAGKYPWQLSGGMQQRVAIARALVYEPSVILMDEPFASVDAQTRADLEDLTRRLQRELNLTVILVTHDIDEAVYLADRVVVLSGAPARVAEIVDVGLGDRRDQIASKSLPAFTEARTRVYSLIRRSGADSPAPSGEAGCLSIDTAGSAGEVR